MSENQQLIEQLTQLVRLVKTAYKEGLTSGMNLTAEEIEARWDDSAAKKVLVTFIQEHCI